MNDHVRPVRHTTLGPHRCVRRGSAGAWWVLPLWVCLLGMLAASCGSDGGVESGVAATTDAATEPLPAVVVTTSIWADVVDNVACAGGVAIETVIPPGGDPHRFEPSLADRGNMEGAALVVANGLRLEEGLDSTLDAVEAGGTPLFRIGDHFDTIAYSAGSDEDHDDDDHGDEDQGDDDDHGDGADPHVWMDPIRVAEMLPELGEHLVEHAGLSAVDVDRCVADFQQQLRTLDAEIVAILDPVPVPQRKLVTNHDSLGYFADRYEFTTIGTVIPGTSGLAATNAAQLEDLALLIERENVKAIFAETQQSSDDAEALASRLDNVEVVTLFAGTLGEPGSGADTYIGLLQTNAALIAGGLG